MQLFVRAGTETKVVFAKRCTKVEEMHEMSCVVFGARVSDVYLHYSSKRLENGKHLHDYNIDHNATLFLMGEAQGWWYDRS